MTRVTSLSLFLLFLYTCPCLCPCCVSLSLSICLSCLCARPAHVLALLACVLVLLVCPSCLCAHSACMPILLLCPLVLAHPAYVLAHPAGVLAAAYVVVLVLTSLPCCAHVAAMLLWVPHVLVSLSSPSHVACLAVLILLSLWLCYCPCCRSTSSRSWHGEMTVQRRLVGI